MKEAYEKLGKNLYMVALTVAKESRGWRCTETQTMQLVRRELEAYKQDPLREAALYGGCVPRKQWSKELTKAVEQMQAKANARRYNARASESDAALRADLQRRLRMRMGDKVKAAFAGWKVWAANPSFSLGRMDPKKDVLHPSSQTRATRQPFQPTRWSVWVDVPTRFFQDIVEAGLFRPSPKEWVLQAEPRPAGGWYARWVTQATQGYAIINHYGLMRRMPDGSLQTDQSTEAKEEYTKWNDQRLAQIQDEG